MNTRREIAACLAAALSVAVPCDAGAGDLAPGMTEHEVGEVLGPPDAVRLERNGVVCLTYAVHEHRVLARLFGSRAHVVSLKENRLVNDETVRTQAINCSDVAARWDPPIRGLPVCDDRWAPRCRP